MPGVAPAVAPDDELELSSADDLLDQMGLDARADSKTAFRMPKRIDADDEKAPEAAAPPSAVDEVPPPAAPAAAPLAEKYAAPRIEAKKNHDQELGDSGHETSYEEFCKMLKLPCNGTPQILPLPKLDPADRLNAVYGGTLMREAAKLKEAKAATAAQTKGGGGASAAASSSPGASRSSLAAPKKISSSAAAAAAATGGAIVADLDADDDLEGLDEGLDESTLEAGGTRDICKSPQHHRLKMDNFVDDEAEDEEAGEAPRGDSDEEEGEWVDVGNESTGSSPQGAVAPSDAAAAAARPPPPAADSAPRADAAAAAEPSSPLAPTGVAPSSANAAENEDACTPFSLDPDFDYDAPVAPSERFSVARALVEGEYYDKLLSEVASAPRDVDDNLPALS